MEGIKKFFPKLKLIKRNVLKKNNIRSFQESLDNNNVNANSNLNHSKNNINRSRKLKTKLNLKKIRIRDNSNRSQDLFITKLKEMKKNNSMRNQKSLGQIAKEMAEQSMSKYLNGNYDFPEEEEEEEEKNESENQSENEENYNNKEEKKEKENISKEKDVEKTSSKRNAPEEKKLTKNYSQDFINLRKGKLGDDKILNQYERYLIKNRLNKISIKIKNKNYQDMLNSYSAMSQNKLIYDNIIRNYKEAMISQYASKVSEFDHLYKMNEKNKKQNIKIFAKLTKSIENNNRTNYLEFDDEESQDSQNENLENSLQNKTS